ncbi:hypothetical protein O181_008450 [Austropuccinia psidii MF-1]|uniref:Uncharacterized protein n=1 Tax=Austropuccinia psidii MF-1 TaxID=1389203 RepID=A0A9Q3BPY8_9BASI|nr:hypothetical protein [Austropuccinia psidii MF-1]
MNITSIKTTTISSDLTQPPIHFYLLSPSFSSPSLSPTISPPLVPILETTLQYMSPSPACSKPPPSQLASLMNPPPHPPDKDNHMIVPEI